MSLNEQATSTVIVNGEQAKQELSALEIKAKQLKEQLQQANKAGDVKAWDSYSKQLKTVNKDMKQMQKESFDVKKILNDLSGSSINDLKRSLRSLEAQMNNGSIKRNTKEWRENAAAQREVKTELGKIRQESAVAEGAFSRLRLQLMGMPGAIGYMSASFAGFFAFMKTPLFWIIGGITALVTGMVSLVKRSMEFGKAVSELKALTGAAGKDLRFLKDQAKELAAQYGKSAVEIVEAMKMVGSAKPELLDNVIALKDTTAAILMLSKATGMDLKQAADSTTTIMNQFNKTGSEANNVVNILAAGSKYGAKEVDYLGDAISKVGTVANAAGLSLETTTAIMELFGEKGIKAEIAGTGFKSLLVQLQSDTRNYTNGLFDLNKAVDNNTNISGDNITLQQKFGKEYFSLAQILFQNKERFIELTEQVTNTTVAEEQMRDATDNLSGDVDKLKSGWDAFMLSLEDGQGPISRATRAITQLFTTAINGLRALTKGGQQKEDERQTNDLNTRVESLKSGIPAKDQEKYINSVIAAEQKIYERNQERANKIKQTIEQNINLGGAWAKQNKKLQADYNEIMSSVNDSKRFVNAAAGIRSQFKYGKGTPSSDDKEDNNTSGSGSASEKAWENEIKASERAYKQMENELLNSVADRKKTMEQFNFEMLFLEVSLGQNKLAILKKYGQDYTDAENNLLNKRIKLAEELSKRAGAKLGTPGLNTSGGVKASDVKMPGSLLNPVIPDNTLDNGVSKYESYADSILNIASRTSDMLNDLQNAELIAVDARYAKQLEAARRAGQDTTILENQIEDEKKEIRKKYADTEFAIAAAQIITETAKGVAASLKTPWLIPFILAGGAAQLGVANAQREAVRNLWTGGYTDPGNKYEPRGIVHAGEFVANQEAVNNPSVNHFLRMIDFAQKNNTIGQVNNETINRWLAVKQGYSQSGNAPQAVSTSAGSGGSAAETAMLMSLIRQGNAVNASLLDEIKKGIKSNVSVTGTGGIREVTKTYDKLMKNASRL